MKKITSTHLNIALALAVCGVLFQNCAAAPPPDISELSSSSYVPTPNAVPANLTCSFAGQVLQQGQSVFAYSNFSLPAGGNCDSVKQTRTCSNGVLSGSFTFASCSVQSPSGTASCSLGGTTVLHGQSITAYLSASAPANSTCVAQSQQRLCTNGTLDGSYTATTCARECTFAGQNILSGQNIDAYLAPSVPNGSSCSKQVRTCNDGVLGGNVSYQYSTCFVEDPPAATPTPPPPGATPPPPVVTDAPCNVNGTEMVHNETRRFYSSDVVYNYTCAYYSQDRTCTNGVVSGNDAYIYADCFREYVDRCGNTFDYRKTFSEAIDNCQPY